jgi:hypothetical protein
MLFRVGKVTVSTTVLESHITPVELIRAFERYIRGDWGDIGGASDMDNDLAIANGSRIVAGYTSTDGVSFAITTFAGRTQILFPAELPDSTGEAIA